MTEKNPKNLVHITLTIGVNIEALDAIEFLNRAEIPYNLTVLGGATPEPDTEREPSLEYKFNGEEYFSGTGVLKIKEFIQEYNQGRSFGMEEDMLERQFRLACQEMAKLPLYMRELYDKLKIKDF